MDTSTMSLDYRIVQFKRCYSFEKQELVSLALYVGSTSHVEKVIQLSKVGFEYGDCMKQDITG